MKQQKTLKLLKANAVTVPSVLYLLHTFTPTLNLVSVHMVLNSVPRHTVWLHSHAWKLGCPSQCRQMAAMTGSSGPVLGDDASRH